MRRASSIFGWLIIASATSCAAAESQRWALLIGVNEYAELAPLKYAGPDMQALAKQLKASGFDDSRLVVMYDQAKDARFRPIRANIAREFTLMLERVRPDDLLLVGFSGHGLWLDGKGYLCPTEAQDADPDKTLISINGLYKQLETCPAALKILLVDACRNDPRPQGRRSAQPKDDLKQLGATFERPPEGLLIFNSCGPGQISWEDEKLGHGVFMHYLLQGLSGGADANKNRKVSLQELFDYSCDNTESYVAKHRRDFQRPAWKGEINGKFEFTLSSSNSSSSRPETPERRLLLQEAARVWQTMERGNSSLDFLKPAASSRLSAWQSAAREGDPIAQYFFGRCLQEGVTIQKNEAEGLQWIRQAAEQGQPLAQNGLGLALKYGNGIPKDQFEAVAWFKKSAEQGFACAQDNFADCCYFGEGCNKDLAEAVRWYRKAADKGVASAQAQLGWCLQNGLGCTANAPDGVYWHRKAAEQGNITAENNLGWCLLEGIGVTKNQTEAIPWFERAAVKGHKRAQTSLGWCALNGFGVKRDPAIAARWLRMAADQGFARAQALLGGCYEKGNGVTRDHAQAIRWYRLAANQGDTQAQAGLRRLNAN